MLLQVAYNEMDIQRIKYVGRLSQAPETVVVPVEKPTTPSVTARLLGLFGAKSLSDEELLAKLRREREKHLKRMQELEQDLEAERKGEQNTEKK